MSEIINDDLINFDEYPLLGQDDDTKDDLMPFQVAYAVSIHKA